MTNGHGKREMLKPEDFTVTTHKDRIVRMTLTESGLKKLVEYRTGNPAADVTLSFAAKVNARPANGRIDNESYLLTYGYPEFDEDNPTKGLKSNKVTLVVPERTTTPPAPSSTPPTTTTTKPVPVPVPVPVPTKVPTPVPETPPTPQETTRVVETTVKEAPPGGESGGPGASGSGSKALAMTGANVIMLLLLGGLLIAGGLFLTMRRNPTNPQSEV